MIMAIEFLGTTTAVMVYKKLHIPKIIDLFFYDSILHKSWFGADNCSAINSAVAGSHPSTVIKDST
jgi:hypothetical protein